MDEPVPARDQKRRSAAPSRTLPVRSAKASAPTPNLFNDAALERLIKDKIDRAVEVQIGKKFRRSNINVLLVGCSIHSLDLEKEMTGDNYSGNTGFVGPNAGSHATATFSTVNQVSSTVDTKILIAELAQLREAMLSDAVAAGGSDPKKFLSISNIASAEESAKSGDVPSAFRFLKSSGKWAFDVATKIGAAVAAKAIEGTIGL